MLVISRKQGERTFLVDRKTGKKIAEVVVVNPLGNKVRLGFVADPASIQVLREEIAPEHIRNEQAPPSPG